MNEDSTNQIQQNVEDVFARDERENRRKRNSKIYLALAGILGLLMGVLYTKYGKGIHLVLTAIAYLIFLYGAYGFKVRENLISQALSEGNLQILLPVLAAPITSIIILYLLY